jgi:hypothetical protein
LVSSDDKKARWEAGLDIDFSKDWEDLQVDTVFKGTESRDEYFFEGLASV